MKTVRAVRAEFLLASILLVLVLPALAVCAETYKWVDGRGTLHITTDPPTEKNAKILSRSENEPTPGEIEQENRQKQKAEIRQHLQFWREQLDFHTGRCLKQETEALCNRGAEIDRKKIEALQSDPDRYFNYVKKHGLVTADFPD